MNDNDQGSQTGKTIQDVAEETLRQVLLVLGLREAEGKDDNDYSIGIIEHNGVTILDIDPDDGVRGVVIGKEARMIEALNTIVPAAVNRRLNRRASIKITVRGYQSPPFRVLARREDRREEARSRRS